MSIIRRVELALLALLLVATAILTGIVLVQRGQLQRAKEAAMQANADSSAASTYGTEVRRILAEKKADEAETEQVLRENPEWSNEPVPPAVADILRKPPAASQ